MESAHNPQSAIGSYIEAEVFSFRQILTGFELDIPTYQREYRWAPEQVSTFLEDAFQDCLVDKLSKFYGAVTWSKEPDSNSTTRSVVDGQQRTTTAFLLVAAIRALLDDLGGNETEVAFCDSLLANRLVSQHDKARQVVEAIGSGILKPTMPDTEIQDPALRKAVSALPGVTYWTYYKKLYKHLSSIVDNHYTETAPQGTTLEDFRVQTTKDFLKVFLDQAGLAVVTVVGHENAVKLFIKQHETLSPLDDFDTLKGALFGITKPADLRKLADGFNSIQERLWGPEASKAKNPAKTLQHVLLGIYNGPKDNPSVNDVLAWAKAGGNGKSSMGFLRNELIPGFKALEAATEKMTNPAGLTSEPLVHIMSTPLKTFKQAYPILVAARNLGIEDFNRVIGCLRDTLLVALCVQGNPNKLSTALAKMARSVNAGEVSAAIEEMISFRDESYSGAFAQEFPKVGLYYPRTSTDGKNVVRLMLLLAANHTASANMLWDKLVDGKEEEGKMYTRDWHVEHIFPQSQAWRDHDFRDPINQKHRLGNLTMLESSVNTSISDGSFEHKKEAYLTSEFPLTGSLPASFSDWGFDSFAARTESLYSAFVSLFSLSSHPMATLANTEPPKYVRRACLPQLSFSGFADFMDAAATGERDRRQVALFAEDRADRQVDYFRTFMEAAGLIEEDGTVKTKDTQEISISEAFLGRWKAAEDSDADRIALFQEAREIIWEGTATKATVVAEFEVVRNAATSEDSDSDIREAAIQCATEALNSMKWEGSKISGDTLHRALLEAYNFLYKLDATGSAS